MFTHGFIIFLENVNGNVASEHACLFEFLMLTNKVVCGNLSVNILQGKSNHKAMVIERQGRWKPVINF